MLVVEDAESFNVPNGIFEDDGDGFRDDKNSTYTETRRHVSYFERLDDKKTGSTSNC